MRQTHRHHVSRAHHEFVFRRRVQVHCRRKFWNRRPPVQCLIRVISNQRQFPCDRILRLGLEPVHRRFSDIPHRHQVRFRRHVHHRVRPEYVAVLMPVQRITGIQFLEELLAVPDFVPEHTRRVQSPVHNHSRPAVHKRHIDESSRCRRHEKRS